MSSTLSATAAPTRVDNRPSSPPPRTSNSTQSQQSSRTLLSLSRHEKRSNGASQVASTRKAVRGLTSVSEAVNAWTTNIRAFLGAGTGHHHGATPQLEAAWKRLSTSDSESLLKKHLTPEIYARLKTSRTSSGATLLDIIQSGVANLDSGTGVYAADEESYRVFAPLFDPIIAEYHGIKASGRRQPAVDFGDPNTLTNLDPAGKYIISTRIRCARSLSAYPLNPLLTKEQYLDMEAKVKEILTNQFQGELKGKYHPLAGMEEDVRQQLVDDHFLFKSGDRFLEAANANRFWPSGRGIFHNQAKTFLVWVNEEDHLRIISMQQGADLRAVYTRFFNALNEIEKSGTLKFARDDDLGYLTFCPTNLGTTIRASVHMKLPKLGEAKMTEIAEKYELQVRGTQGEHSESEGGVFDISNKRRLGLTEYQAVKTLQDGVLEMIRLEESL